MIAKRYYVTMTDKFLSGWGMAQGKINKLVITCETYQEAETVERNCLNRSDMKFVNVRSTRPYYNQNHYFVSWHDKNDYPNLFKPGAF